MGNTAQQASGAHGCLTNWKNQRHGSLARPSQERFLDGFDQRPGLDPSSRSSARGYSTHSMMRIRVFVPDRLAAGWKLVSGALGKVGEIGVGGFKLALCKSDPSWIENWRQHGDTFLKQARKTGVPILSIVDELPDMLLNLSQKDVALLREFLAWFRTQRLNPAPAKDSIRWLVGGSVNLAGTLDALGQVDLINDLEEIPLPPLTDGNIRAFVTEMLSGRGVPYQGGCSTAARLSPGSSYSASGERFLHHRSQSGNL